MAVITVAEAARRLGIGLDTVRSGIIEGTLPGTVIHLSPNRMKFHIPEKPVEFYLETGITPMMLAQSICGAETIEQGIAIIRAVFKVEENE